MAFYTPVTSIINQIRIHIVEPFVRKDIGIDPYFTFSECTNDADFESSMNDFLQLESAKHNLPENRSFREALYGYPGFRGTGSISRNETNLQTSLAQPPLQATNTIRTRGATQGSPVLLMWLISYVFACSPEFRIRMIAEAQMSDFLFIFMSDVFKYVRSSRCGGFSLTPYIMLTTWNKIKVFQPQLIGTCYDPEWLDSDAGFEWSIGFINHIRYIKGNYIPSTTYTPSNLPPLLSGLTTSILSIVQTPGSIFGRSEQIVLPGSSLAPNIPILFFVESIALNIQIMNDKTSTNPFLMDLSFVNSYQSAYSDSDIRIHIIHRVTQVFKYTSNDGGSPSKRVPPKLVDNSSFIIEDLPSVPSPSGSLNPPPIRKRDASSQSSGKGVFNRGRLNSRDNFSKFEDIVFQLLSVLKTDNRFKPMFA